MFERNNLTIAFNMYMLKQKKYFQLIFKKSARIVKNKLFLCSKKIIGIITWSKSKT